MHRCLLLALAFTPVAFAQTTFDTRAAVPAVTVEKPPTVRRAQPVRPAVPVAPDTALGDVATFRPGDSFELRMTGMPLEDAAMYALSFTIGADGYVNIPLGGQLRASGLTQSQLEKAIERRLVDEKIFRWPTATINVPTQARFVTVGGAVRAPQRIMWSADLTVLSAITAAGGAGDFGGKWVDMIRRGKPATINLKELKKDPSKDFPLLPGDQLELR
jgi:protein involved in polysaccharide export with SLBB domain